MRTKTLLLTAAAIAAGLFAINSQAQSNVYSANIVGYTTGTNAASAYAMLANPLDNGTNDLNSLLPTAPNGTTVYIFSGGLLDPSSKTKGAWNHDFIIPPGTGFFVSTPTAITNTFVGQVSGYSNGLGSNGIVCPAGITELVGSPIPFAGSLSDTGTNTMNLNALPNGSTVNMLIGGLMATSQKSKGSWSHNFSINPSQGFYLNSPTATNVIQYLVITN